MTTKAYSSEKTNNAIDAFGKKIYFILFSLMCVAIFIVSFIAFLKIENNLHAFLVFSIGTALTILIFVNGRKP